MFSEFSGDHIDVTGDARNKCCCDSASYMLVIRDGSQRISYVGSHESFEEIFA